MRTSPPLQPVSRTRTTTEGRLRPGGLHQIADRASYLPRTHRSPNREGPTPGARDESHIRSLGETSASPIWNWSGRLESPCERTQLIIRRHR